MSGLKSRVNNLINNNFVYFSYHELALTRDFFKHYLDELNAVPKDYENQFRELEDCLQAHLKDGSCDYQARVRELAERDLTAHYAYLYKVYIHLCDSHQDGWWLWDMGLIDRLSENYTAAKNILIESDWSRVKPGALAGPVSALGPMRDPIR